MKTNGRCRDGSRIEFGSLLAEGIVAQIQPISNYDNDDEMKGVPY